MSFERGDGEKGGNGVGVAGASGGGSSWPCLGSSHLPPRSPSSSTPPTPCSSSTPVRKFEAPSPSELCLRPDLSSAFRNNRKHERTPSAPAETFGTQAGGWFDDVLSIPEAPPRKFGHRRCISDPVAFLEVGTTMNFLPLDKELSDEPFPVKEVMQIPGGSSDQFEKMEDSPWLSMFMEGGGVGGPGSDVSAAAAAASPAAAAATSVPAETAAAGGQRSALSADALSTDAARSHGWSSVSKRSGVHCVPTAPSVRASAPIETAGTPSAESMSEASTGEVVAPLLKFTGENDVQSSSAGDDTVALEGKAETSSRNSSAISSLRQAHAENPQFPNQGVSAEVGGASEALPLGNPTGTASGADVAAAGAATTGGNLAATVIAGNGVLSKTSDPLMDEKRARRILANRQSAQRSRVRKLQYISELEKRVTSLQSDVASLSPQVAYLDRQRVHLNAENSALKQKMAAVSQDTRFKDALNEALRKEISRLKVVHSQQVALAAAAVAGQPPPQSTFALHQRQLASLELGSHRIPEVQSDEMNQLGSLGGTSSSAAAAMIMTSIASASGSSHLLTSMMPSTCMIPCNGNSPDARVVSAGNLSMDYLLHNK